MPPPDDDAEPDTPDPDAEPDPPPAWAAEMCDLFPEDDEGDEPEPVGGPAVDD